MCSLAGASVALISSYERISCNVMNRGGDIMRGMGFREQLCARKFCCISVRGSNAACADSIVLVCGQNVNSSYFNSV